MGPPFAAIRHGGLLPQHLIAGAAPRPSFQSLSFFAAASARGDYSYAPRENEPLYDNDDDYLPQTEEITSLQNSVVKHCVKLRTQKSYRDASRTALLTGADLVAELQGTIPDCSDGPRPRVGTYTLMGSNLNYSKFGFLPP